MSAIRYSAGMYLGKAPVGEERDGEVEVAVGREANMAPLPTKDRGNGCGSKRKQMFLTHLRKAYGYGGAPETAAEHKETYQMSLVLN